MLFINLRGASKLEAVVKLAIEICILFETLQGNEADLLLIPFGLLIHNHPPLFNLSFTKQLSIKYNNKV
jgi:hypothetical protein